MSKLKQARQSRDGVLGLAALIVAVTALVVALVGAAGAAPSRVIVRKGDIEPGAITAKDLAKGSVRAKAIAKGAVHGSAIAKDAIHSRHLASESVNERSLKKGAVGTASLANNAVTATQLAPGSVYGGAFGAETLVTKPIADLDAVAHNGEWTASNAETVICGAGETLLSPGFAFTSSGNGQVSWLEALPIVNGPTRGVTGRITTDTGGTAAAEIAALCLK